MSRTMSAVGNGLKGGACGIRRGGYTSMRLLGRQ